MNVPLEISYRNVEKSDDLEELIMEKVAKLEQAHSRITSCRVAVERVQAHEDLGSPYHVRVDITVPPNHELYVENGAAEDTLHPELPTIIRQVFKTAFLQLRELGERQRDHKQRPETAEEPEQQL